MQSKTKWFLIPPALAVILFLGPLRDAAPAPRAPQERAASEQPKAAERAAGAGLPAAPGLWQVGSALLGVLLLGGGLLYALARWRGAPAAAGAPLVQLRQSLRLSARHHVHALQFDERLLLVGECDGRLTVLTSCAGDESVADEQALRERDTDDEGAVPRDMVLPHRKPQQVLKPPRASGRAAIALADFKRLLRRPNVPAEAP
jgi:flagellar biogenesis protein FliO